MRPIQSSYTHANSRPCADGPHANSRPPESPFPDLPLVRMDRAHTREPGKMTVWKRGLWGAYGREISVDTTMPPMGFSRRPSGYGDLADPQNSAITPSKLGVAVGVVNPHARTGMEPTI